MNPFKRINWRSRWRVILAIVLGVLGSVFLGISLHSEWSYGNTQAEIAEAQGQADRLIDRLAAGSVAWRDIQDLADDLTYFNQRKVQLKVLRHVSAPPTEYPLNWVWKERYSLGQRAWNRPDPNAFNKSILIGAGSVLASIPAAWLALVTIAVLWFTLGAVVSTIWYFVLNRIREVSNAITGRPITGAQQPPERDK